MMNLKLLLFANLREKFGFSQKDIHLPEVIDSPESFLFLMARESGGDWKELLKDQSLYRVAINQNLSSWTDALENGDELAIFPPITGG
mgnify:CR=1 FL=1